MKRGLAAAVLEGFDPAAGARAWPWLLLTLLAATIPAGEALVLGFAHPFVVQDDARQFVFWMRRWADPALFPGDLIADYFQSVSPVGFEALYRAAWWAGIDPVALNKLLPLPLSLATGYFAFRLTLRLWPAPGVAFLAAWLTLFFIWLLDTVASGTPRSFAVPCLLAFATFLVERRPLAVGLSIAAAGVTYPQMVLVQSLALGLSMLRWQDGRPDLSRARRDWLILASGAVAAVLTLGPFALATSDYGPVIDAAAARSDPSFQPGGRSEFFFPDALEMYVCRERAGILPDEWGCGQAFRTGLAAAPFLAILLLCAAFGPPILLVRRAGRPESLLGERAPVLLALVASGLILWGLAHLLLFQLHLPSRYGQYPLRSVTMIALMLVLAPALTRAARSRWRGAAASALAATVAGLLILPLPLPYSPNPLYVEGREAGLYTYLQDSPKGVVVASLLPEGANVPVFARRSILASREHMIPYSLGYAARIDARIQATVGAQYATDAAPLERLAHEFGATLLLLPKDAFEPEQVGRAWWRDDFPALNGALREDIAGGADFLVARHAKGCSVWDGTAMRLVSVACLIERAGWAR